VSLVIRTIVLALAWFACINALGTIVAAWVAYAFRDRAAAFRPSLLLGIRLFPSGMSLLFVGVAFLPAHWAWEPRDVDETLGFGLRGLAIVGAALLVRSVWRALVTAWASHQVRIDYRPYRRGGPNTYVVDGLPGVSLAGVLRPRILIGRSVKAQLSRTELELAVAHEVAHRDAFDNLARWCVLCAPDFLAGTRIASRLEHAWHVAAESRADARAICGNQARAVHLASALIKVARLSAPATGRVSVPSWSTLNDSELLEWRVKRLLDGTLPQMPSLPRLGLAATILAGSVLIAVPIVAGPVHRLTETLVAFLP
jgi:Zn-dependent protease with chaperone function